MRAQPNVMTSVRLDVWLDVSCLYRTRSEAQRACHGGKVEVNGQTSKPHRLLRVGDEIRLSRPYGRKQMLTVLALADRHIAKAEARLLYNDTTPADFRRREGLAQTGANLSGGHAALARSGQARASRAQEAEGSLSGPSRAPPPLRRGFFLAAFSCGCLRAYRKAMPKITTINPSASHFGISKCTQPC